MTHAHGQRPEYRQKGEQRETEIKETGEQADRQTDRDKDRHNDAKTENDRER